MGDIHCFNNKLSFLKSVTTLIVPFFLQIANDEKAHLEELSSSRTQMSTSLMISLRNCCSTDLGTVYARA
jgi:hypothetical protein